MARHKAGSAFARLMARNARTMTRFAQQATTAALKPVAERRKPPRGAGDWIAGLALAPGAARRFHLHRPPGAAPGERLPLLVMLHGCGQDARRFAISTRMNALANRERFLVLYPEQDRVANAQGCWNWFDTRSGRAQREADVILAAVDQACLLHGADRERVAVAGLSAGGGMAALLASRHPARFRAVAMHAGVGPGAAHSSATAIAAMQGRRAPAHEFPGALPPLLVIQGDADPVVAPGNASAAALAWAHAGGAREGAPRTVQRGRRRPMQVTEFRRSGRAFVVLAQVEGLAHAWSGGAAGQPFSDPRGPDASRLVWAFAQKQFKAR
jgi:poly(hydroxyalkanoate) depolymerase family esterase